MSSTSIKSTPESIVPQQGMGLYVHVPFCATKCPYCDFNTYQGIESLLEPFLEALTAEGCPPHHVVEGLADAADLILG